MAVALTGLKICVDARMPDGRAGGIQQVVTGLASGLAALDGEETYHFLSPFSNEHWLEPYLGRNTTIIRSPEAGTNASRRILSHPLVRPIWQGVGARRGPLALKVQASDGTIERLQIDVMHFTQQHAFLTHVPSIYHPHDLQHVHLPQFTSRRERAGRDVLYSTLCRQAAVVAVSSEWARQDMIGHLQLAPEKVRVVPLAPATEAYPPLDQETIDEAERRIALPQAFIFYPAQTWPHKNHLGLIRALEAIRDRHGLAIPLICAGATNDFFHIIRNEIRRAGLAETCRFLGFVSASDLQVLYARCAAVVIPTKFEAASFPLWEAFLSGSPAACSTVTSLPEQAGDAALLFDPDDIEAMAGSIWKLWTEPATRKELSRKGRERVRALSWKQTALQFRSIYREIAAQTALENS